MMIFNSFTAANDYNFGARWPDGRGRNLREFGAARSEELEVNQWIVQDIHWLSSHAIRVREKHYPLF